MNEKLVREAIEVGNDLNLKSSEAAEKMIDLLNEALAPQPAFYKDQQVLMRDSINDGWIRKTLTSISSEAGLFYCKSDIKGSGNPSWKYCKPDPEAVTRPVWIEHDGSSGCLVELFRKVHIEFEDGSFTSVFAKDVYWRTVTRYFIVPEYEPLET